MRVGSIVVFILVVFVQSMNAQSSGISTSSAQPLTGINRFEFGTQVADIRTGCIGASNCSLPSFGLGFGGSLNVNSHFALDAAFFKTPQSSRDETNISGGRASELLIGARAEIRARHYGYFLKAQPGYFRWSGAINSLTFPTSSTFSLSFGSRTHFVTDLGAGFEYSPGGHFHIRAEVTDLMMRYSSSIWTQNLQPTAGLYVGLGKQVEWQPPIYNPRAVHSFLNSTNLTLVAASLLAVTADGVTTQRFLKQGISEGDPFARPLVKYGWSGQISLTSLEIGAEIAGMYSLHRMGQHWVERILPAGIATTHGIFAYNNTKLSKHAPLH